MLHLVSKAKSLESCLRVAQDNDVILLIEDGVETATQNIKSNLQFYALKSDLESRELLDKISPHIKLINYEEFVDLTLQHHPSQTWS